MRYTIINSVMWLLCTVGLVNGAAKTMTRAMSSRLTVEKAVWRHKEYFDGLLSLNSPAMRDIMSIGSKHRFFINQKHSHIAWCESGFLKIKKIGEEGVQVLSGNNINSLCWHSDELLLAVGCVDGKVYIIKIPEHGTAVSREVAYDSVTFKEKEIAWVAWEDDNLSITVSGKVILLKRKLGKENEYELPQSFTLPSPGTGRYIAAQATMVEVNQGKDGAYQLTLLGSQHGNTESDTFLKLLPGDEIIGAPLLNSDGNTCAVVVENKDEGNVFLYVCKTDPNENAFFKILLPWPLTNDLACAWHDKQSYLAVIDSDMNLHIIYPDLTCTTFVSKIEGTINEQSDVSWVGDALLVTAQKYKNDDPEKGLEGRVVSLFDGLIKYSDKDIQVLNTFFTDYEKQGTVQQKIDEWEKALYELPPGSYRAGALALLEKARNESKIHSEVAIAQASPAPKEASPKALKKPSPIALLLKWSVGIGLMVGIGICVWLWQQKQAQLVKGR